MRRRSIQALCAGLVLASGISMPASVSAATYTNSNGTTYYTSSNPNAGNINGRTYYVTDDGGMTYVVNGRTYYVAYPNDPIANGLLNGVNVATVGPPANSLNSQIRQACGLPNYTFPLGSNRYQDIIGNGVTTGVNIATTYNNRNPGTPGCTVTATPASNGQPGQVTVRTNPVTATTNPYAVKVVTPTATTTRVYVPTTTTTDTTGYVTTPTTTGATSFTTTPTTTYTYPQDTYTTTTTTPSATTYRVFVDPWDATIRWTPVTATGGTTVVQPFN